MISRATPARTLDRAERDEHGRSWLLGGLENARVMDTIREQSGRAED